MQLPSSLIGFALVGLVSTTVDIVLLNLIRRLGAPVLIATALGFLGGATTGYLLNSYWVFQTEYGLVHYEKYFSVALGGLLLTELIMEILHVKTKWLTMNQAKIAAVCIVFFWNYGLSKLWVFAS